ncbi:DUF2238 domain-containing protein [Patescibacteria group bacterium]|nr:DUF2238 domain-containing protein [Patescibacteria group bacterium]
MRKLSNVSEILIFTVGYLIFFGGLAVYEKNFEFLFYAAVMIFLIWLALDVYHRIKLQKWIIICISLLGLLHMAGGNLTLNEVRLYDFEIIPGLIRYDNVVHFFGTFILTFIAYSLIHPIIDDNLKRKKRLLFMWMLVLMALGVGAVNEIIELVAVEFLDASAGVGDYTNNAVDLVFNLFGSVLACFIIYHYYRKEEVENIYW